MYLRVLHQRQSQCWYWYVYSFGFLLTDRPVRADVAMTGEITLRGEVLPELVLKEEAF